MADSAITPGSAALQDWLAAHLLPGADGAGQQVGPYLRRASDVPAAGPGTTLVDPASGRPFASVTCCGAEHVEAAVKAGLRAQQEWAEVPWLERTKAMWEFARRIEQNAAEIAALDSCCGGFPITHMEREIAIGAGNVYYAAGLASQAMGHSIPIPAPGLDFTLREPHGLVARILPFNHPGYVASRGIASPVVMGNAILLKPSELTPLSAIRLAELTEGLVPAGLVAVLTGDGSTGQHIVEHPQVGRVAFTGSTATGRLVLRAAAETITEVTLELGGKNPGIVFPDADLGLAARQIVAAMNLRSSQGQSCGSPSRVLAHRSIRAHLVELLAAEMTSIRIGDPWDPATEMGPLASEAQYTKVTGHIDRAMAEGAKLRTGGGRPAAQPDGYFVEPTLFDEVTTTMTISREEVFGPVVAVLDWDDETDVIELANALPYGLGAYVWTADLETALRMTRRLHAGFVWVNGQGQRPSGVPFGGIKESGTGADNCLEELLSYTRLKNVYLQQHS